MRECPDSRGDGPRSPEVVEPIAERHFNAPAYSPILGPIIAQTRECKWLDSCTSVSGLTGLTR
jgi:hypothetical protein